MYCEKTSLATKLIEIKQNKCELNVKDYQRHTERTIFSKILKDYYFVFLFWPPTIFTHKSIEIAAGL